MKKKEEKKIEKDTPKFYKIDNLIESDPTAKYFMLYGERSNGKTFQVLNIILFGFHDNLRNIHINGYFDDGSRGGILRRYREDFNGGNALNYWMNNFIENKYEGNILAKRTKNKWNTIKYIQRKFYLAYVDPIDEKNNRTDPNPFCYTMSLSEDEHNKGGGYANCNNLLFDEFIARGYYLPNEFTSFMNTISTIVRADDKLKIFMCGNTINRYCSYFDDMGLYKIKNQRKGTIDVYQFGESGELRVAVEYTDSPSKKKKSDIYFAFDNPKLKMITTGEWEIALYPHLPKAYFVTDVLYMYFVNFEDEILQCEIVYVNHEKEAPVLFTYVHRKTTPIKDNNKYLVYQKEFSPKENYSRKMNHPKNQIEQKCWRFFQTEKVFYQDNTVGEVMRNYLMWCHTDDMEK